MKLLLAAAAGGLAMLAACLHSQEAVGGGAGDQVQASAAGPAVVALHLSDRQLLEANLIDGSGVDSGDVEVLLRNAGGQVHPLLLEIEGADPDLHLELATEGMPPAPIATTPISSTQ